MEKIVAVARTYVGTKFHHQGRLKGVGVDCVGLLVGVASEVGISTTADTTNYKRRNGYETLIPALTSVMDEVAVEAIQPGDVLVFTIQQEPQHVAIYSENDMIIHAVDPMGVVEVTFDEMWRKWLHSAYRVRRV